MNWYFNEAEFTHWFESPFTIATVKVQPQAGREYANEYILDILEDPNSNSVYSRAVKHIWHETLESAMLEINNVNRGRARLTA